MNPRTISVGVLSVAFGCLVRSGGVHAAPAPAEVAAFEQALARNYDALAQAEAQLGDERDAVTYTARAQAARNGTPSAPDEIARRQPFLKEKYVADLSAARARLMTGLSSPAMELVPVAAARAQTGYDCWLEQAAEDLQPDDIEACKRSFLLAMDEMDNAVANRAQPDTAAASSAPPATPPPSAPPLPYLVYFEFDRAEITPAAQDVIANFAADVGRRGAREILARGYTDSAGAERYNLHLSLRRAEAVRSALAAMNLPVDRIDVEGRGEAEQRVATGDEVREAGNRRVELSAH